MGNAVALLLSVLQVLPSLIAAGQQVESLISDAIAVVTKAQSENRDPTPEEWAIIDNQREALSAALHT